MTQGITDATGQASFGLPTGQYKAIISKDGFASLPAQDIVVMPNAEEAPTLYGVVPSPLVPGADAVLFGIGLTEDTLVLFGSTEVSGTYTPSTGQVSDYLKVEVPMGLTGPLVAVRLKKPASPDPLLSNVITCTVGV